METLLVHEPVAARFLPGLYDLMDRVQWYACPVSEEILRGKARVSRASPSAWDTEYLDLKINCRVVHSIEQAIEHIRLHGSRHSEAIVTASEPHARFFQKNIDAAAVYWNASTRFTDGFTLGLGGELGISTQKLHVRGPVGLKELTSVRWVIDGASQANGGVLASIREK
jgi:glutamate-5-semialdehyde dehydrogenase